jgi:hypothetical protein
MRVPVPVLFQGEMMSCCMCGAKEKSDPGIETGWRAVQLDECVFYVCPKELPPNGSSAKEYGKAYSKVIGQCVELLRKKRSAVRN